MNDRSAGFSATASPASQIGAADLVVETTTQSFRRDVLDESRQQPVLVDFWAPWCGPCRTLGPVIEKTVREAKGKVRLVKMNIDDHPAIANQLGIQSIPAVIAFSNGQPVDGFVGALPESQVKAFIERISGPGGPSDADALLGEADALLAEGEAAAAEELYEAVLQSEPEDVRALTGLARAAMASGDLERARQALDAVPDAKAKDALVSAARAQLALVEQTAQLGDTGKLRARVAADPKDYDARFDLALALNGAGDRQGATDLLLDIMRQDRTWNEEKARKQLVQFFDAWGPMDEATRSGRRKLSSLLFA